MFKGLNKLPRGRSRGGWKFTAPVDALEKCLVVDIKGIPETLIPKLDVDRDQDNIIFLSKVGWQAGICIRNNGDPCHGFSNIGLNSLTLC
jgi:hypothetical protein